MKCCKNINSMIKKIDCCDMGLIKLSVMAFALMLAKLWSPLMSLDWYWYALAFIVFAIRPLKKVCC